MVEWGAVNLPELDFRPTFFDVTKNPAEPGLVHFPTGLRIDFTGTLVENRGEWRDYLIYAPAGEDWLVRVSIYDVTHLTNRVEKHFGIKSLLFGTPIEDRNRLRNAFLREFGHDYLCSFMAAEHGYSMPDWTEDRRDAVVMMLFWFLEADKSSPSRNDPYPSKMTFKEKVPAAFLDKIFKNPAWDRL